jgi:chemotaxis family two-component system response regulator Rcp1
MTQDALGTLHLRPAIGRPIRILLVEDSPSDVAMTVAALRDGRIANVMYTVGDGVAAMEFLYGVGDYVGFPRPDLILLDLNLPRKDGREVLAEIRSDDSLTTIPVVMLTTSSAESDVLGSYRLHANSYVTKPVGYDAFLTAIRGIEAFWLSLVLLPSAPE